MNPTEAAKREHEVIGLPPRIAPLAQEELGVEARAIVQKLRDAFNHPPLAVLSEYFAVLARHPGVFRSQIETGIMYFNSATLPKRDRELITLRIAWLAGAPYEWSEHVHLAHACGLAPEDTDRVRQGPSAPGWSEQDRTLLTAVDELINDRMIGNETWAGLAKVYSEVQLVELPAFVGQYLAVAMTQNTLRIPLLKDRNGFAER